jgi:hypothetical protein
MHVLETSIQRLTKIESLSLSINDLASALPRVSRDYGLEHARQVIEAFQEQFIEKLFAGLEELVCERCGVVHSGRLTLLRRGSRQRTLRTSIGVLVFALKQLTCRDCRRTWSPFAQLLGLAPRQRIAEELVRKMVEGVTELSYAKTCEFAEAWLGASVTPRTLHRFVQERGAQLRFTPAEPTRVVVADGTKVPAGSSERGTDVRLSFQILERYAEHGRVVVEKRIAGWGMGPGGWSDALPAGICTEVIVSDREKGLPELIAERFPGIRHQHCEWHLSHTLGHLLYLDGVKVKERRPLTSKLSHIIWGKTTKDQRAAYVKFCAGLENRPKAHTMLSDALENVLFEKPSSERTSSVMEREMREINRRSDVGVRWSERGIDNLLRLRAARRINKDDFERVWSPVNTTAIKVVPLA